MDCRRHEELKSMSVTGFELATLWQPGKPRVQWPWFPGDAPLLLGNCSDCGSTLARELTIEIDPAKAVAA